VADARRSQEEEEEEVSSTASANRGFTIFLCEIIQAPRIFGLKKKL
jgi:hypothetical protein